MKHFKFLLKTPASDAFDGKVTKVHLATEGGELECMANHASLTATVAFSPVVLDVDGGQEEFMVRNGLFLFDNKSNTARLLALNVQKRSEMDETTVKDYLKFIDEKLAAGEDLSEFQILYLEGEKLAVEKQMELMEV